MKAWKCSVLMAVAGCLFAAGSAHAESVELTLTGITGSTGDYVWTYNAVLTPTNMVSTGDAVELQGFDQGDQSGAGTAVFVPSESGADYTDGVLGTIKIPSVFDMSPSLGLLFTYDGTSPLTDNGSGNLDLGNFVIDSQYNTGASSLQLTTSETSTGDADVYTAVTAVAAAGGFTLTPLPKSVFGAASLLGLIAFARIRRSNIAIC